MRERSAGEIERVAAALAGRGIAAAGRYLANEIRRVISVPVPPGRPPATPGAPPRRDTGRLRASIDSWQVDESTVRVGSQRVVYARPLETWMGHPYLLPTMTQQLPNLARIVGQAVQTGSNV